MSTVILKEVFAERWTQENAFDKARAIEGEIAKAKDNRRVIKFALANDAYYLKYHQGVGWKEIFKNLLQLKLPVLGASNEWFAIERLGGLDVETMQAVAFGRCGFNPATQESFLITKELKDTITLEQFCAPWKTASPSFSLKKKLIEQLAVITKELHENGLNHRDLYLCHFLLDAEQGVDAVDGSTLKIFLVDLHRMQIRSKVPRRWLVKDVGSLYFSAMDIGLNRKDIYRFLKTYTGLPLRAALQSRPGFWQQVRHRADKIYLRDWKRLPDDIFGR